jgi:soluble lytic murein transglycosylase
VLAAGMMLYEAGQAVLAERFLTHLTETQDRDGAGQLGALALALDDPHLALRIAKRAAQFGHTLPDAYYPLHPLTEQDLPTAPELALSIARRESEFDPLVISPAGALGLMQIMPKTAQAVAERRGILYSRRDVLYNSGLNADLGAAYLYELEQEFNGNPVLISAAYNAGPSRADDWIERFGDPRDPGVDIIDWIEMIPFRETRNYIMRVTESLPVYAARLGWDSAQPLEFTTFLKGARVSPAPAPATR